VESEYQKPLAIAIQTVKKAGEILRENFHLRDSQKLIKQKIEFLLVEKLSLNFPHNGISSARQIYQNCNSTYAKQNIWLIDALDGKSHFFKGTRGSSISIALLTNNIPVLGVVFAFCAPNDNGDIFTWAQDCGPLRRNETAILRNIWSQKFTSDTNIIVSPEASNNPLAISKLIFPARFLTMPSIAYRLALVAAGEAEVAFSINNPSIWDYAAGHALLRGVGGELLDSMGKPIVYSQGNANCWGSCFGGSPVLASLMATQKTRINDQLTFVKSNRLFEPATLVKGETIKDTGLLERASGCLLGQLAGDSLGSLVEFKTAQSINAEKLEHLQDGGTWNTIAGQLTDDSELALMLARSLVRAKKFDLQAIAQAYVYWYKSSPFDIGNTIAQAFSSASRAMDANEDLCQAARLAAYSLSQANGALMRISPLAIFGHALSDEELANYARADASLTHVHPFCQDANAIFVVAIKYALVNGSNGEQVYQYAIDWAKKKQLHIDVLQTLTDAQIKPPENYSRSMGWVKIALQNAFYQCLHALDLKTGIVDTITRGGDTDTNAAIAGALLGAIHGYSAIPLQWRSKLTTCRPIRGLKSVYKPRPEDFWPVDALVLAECLLMTGKQLK